MLQDGRFRWATAILALLLTSSFLAGWHDFHMLRGRNESAQQAERQRWLNQGIKSQHSAGDQGLVVFQPLLALYAFDSGVLPYTGTFALLGGHHEKVFTAKPAEDRNSLRHLGELTAASALQLFVPLLIILLAYDAFAGERERGTMRQILALGVSSRELALGKLIGNLLPLACVLVPMTILGAAILGIGSAYQTRGDSLARLSVTALAHFCYFAIVAGIALAVSARAATSRQALVLLLTFWFFGHLLAPLLATDFAQALNPAPTSLDHASAVMRAEEELPTVEERRAALRYRLLQQYHVTSLRELPVDPIGIELLEAEQDETPLFHGLVSALYDTYERQTRVYQACGALAPMLVLQSLSRGLAESDFAAHRDFAEAAEIYRVKVMHTLNESIAYDPNYHTNPVFPGTDIVVSHAGPELWQRIPSFVYRPTTLGRVLARNRGNISILVLWFALATAFLRLSVARIKAD